ncbi:tRNA uridine(34) 5-carboxymethylaminomethyl modification radical SAM/GNAT enzyme Elp3, partial [Candidatus Peregrinibacteria bacterium]|nr:tRNA uridine(34) 5-carboxymethylaminomethyl modification radical SAM/GNAT enzyme Elp3 [Candidatus Peregrinibacteria bacterium]
GVQSLSDEVHNLCKRGHGVAEVITATELLRNAGFKVVYHMMLNLPGSNPKQDVEMFKELFSNPAFCPDQIKIYPCVLTKDAELATWYKDGKWKPYSDDVLADTIIKIKKFIPEYCRVIRVIRDIPSTDIVAGSKSSNLRQILQQKGMKCRCIRCRDIRSLKVNELSLVNREYEAVGGKEIFISYEDNTQDKLVAMLRLRIPSGDSKMHFSALKYAAIVRELHVYGMHTPIGDKGKSAQHTGLGKKLLKEAERISKKHGKKKIAIISGIGVRDYYRKQGYTLKDEYMVKGI